MRGAYADGTPYSALEWRILDYNWKYLSGEYNKTKWASRFSRPAILDQGLPDIHGEKIKQAYQVETDAKAAAQPTIEPQPGVTENTGDQPIDLPGREAGTVRPTVAEKPATIAAQIDAMVNGRGSRVAVIIPPGEKGPNRIPKGYTRTRTSEGVVIHATEISPSDIRNTVAAGDSWTLLGHENADNAEATRIVVARAGEDVPRLGLKAGDELMSSYVKPGNEQNVIDQMKEQFGPFNPQIEVGGAETTQQVVGERTTEAAATTAEQPAEQAQPVTAAQPAEEAQPGWRPGMPRREAAAPAETTTPQWLKENIERRVKAADALGISDQIEQLSRERLTARQVAQRLADEHNLRPDETENLVRAVRADRGIPSMDDKTEFEAWLGKEAVAPGAQAREEEPEKEPEPPKRFEGLSNAEIETYIENTRQRGEKRIERLSAAPPGQHRQPDSQTPAEGSQFKRHRGRPHRQTDSATPGEAAQGHHRRSPSRTPRTDPTRRRAHQGPHRPGRGRAGTAPPGH